MTRHTFGCRNLESQASIIETIFEPRSLINIAIRESLYELMELVVLDEGLYVFSPIFHPFK